MATRDRLSSVALGFLLLALGIPMCWVVVTGFSGWSNVRFIELYFSIVLLGFLNIGGVGLLLEALGYRAGTVMWVWTSTLLFLTLGCLILVFGLLGLPETYRKAWLLWPGSTALLTLGWITAWLLACWALWAEARSLPGHFLIALLMLPIAGPCALTEPALLVLVLMIIAGEWLGKLWSGGAWGAPGGALVWLAAMGVLRSRHRSEQNTESDNP